RTLYAETPSHHVDWSAGSVRLLGEPVAWAGNGHARRAGVSSFGISGTNAHVIVEEAPLGEPLARESTRAARPACWPVLVSGKTEGALRAQAERLRAHLEARADLEIGDVAYSLAVTRTHFERRAVVVAKDKDALVRGLDALVQGNAAADLLLGHARGDG